MINNNKNLIRKSFLAFAAFVLFAAAAFAQSGKTNPPQSVPENSAPAEAKASLIPRMSVSAESLPPVLQDLKIDVEVVGNLAMTTYDMVFYNPGQFVTEGEFIMLLSEKQSVSSVSLDINGKLRNGVAVEKQKIRQNSAAAAKEESDAGTAGKTSADRFTMKVYPFNPEGTRRIKITLEEPLEIKNDAYVYALPLEFGASVNFDLNIEIPSGIVEGFPLVEANLPDFEFKKGNNVVKAGFSQRDFFLNDKLSIVLPRQKTEPVFTHKDGKQTYFYTDIGVKPSSKNKTLPKNITIVWDTSLSCEKRDIKRDIALLDAYFKRLSDAEVSFVPFNIAPGVVKKYSVIQGKWEELKKEISRIIYDGATSFEKLDLNSFKTEEIILFTDGISTLGKTRISAGSVPVYAINSSSGFRRSALLSAAEASGGHFIDLNSVTDKQALDLLTKQNLRLVSYSFDKSKVKGLYPKPGAEISGNFAFAGILTSAEGEIILKFGYDKNNIVFEKKIKIRAEGDNPAVERIWAARKIKYLELDKTKNEKEILNLAMKYSLATGLTSLMVLENAAEYAAYKVKPPRELAEECNKISADMRKEEKSREKAALEDAVLQVQDIKNWWMHDYKRGNAEVSPESSETAFGVNRTQIFGASMPAASEGEVNAPPSRPQKEVYGVKSAVLSGSAALSENGAAVKKGKESGFFAGMKMKAWDPQAPYMKIIRNSFDEEAYSDYLKLKAGYGDQPSFYFDIADEFIRREMKDEAVIVLSNIAEMKLDSPELLRVAAYKLMEIKSYSYAADIFEKIVKIRGEDPQSHRELALAYQSNREYKKALKTFYNILTNDWERFQSIKQVVFVEMNNLISLNPDINTAGIDKRLIFAMPVDIRIVLGWSTGDTDIDIYVTDPRGEKASYANRFTDIGGRVSEDLTQGFGPEEFMLKKAVDGKYEISTDYVADEKHGISGPTVLYLDIYTFYGTKKQTHKRVMIRTDNVKENDVVGTVEFKRPAK